MSHMFKIPKVLWPRRESVDCFLIPNVAVGRVNIDDKILPIFSAFFSHAMFLRPDMWKMVRVPQGALPRTTSDGMSPSEVDLVGRMEKCHVSEVRDVESKEEETLLFVIDPSTLYVFGDSVAAVFMDKSDTMAAMKLFLPEGADPDEHWKGVGERYEYTYRELQKTPVTGALQHMMKPMVSSDKAKEETQDSDDMDTRETQESDDTDVDKVVRSMMTDLSTDSDDNLL